MPDSTSGHSCSGGSKHFHIRGKVQPPLPDPDLRLGRATQRHLAVCSGASALLDWLGFWLCEFVLDGSGCSSQLRLGRSRVVFGSESNVRNMPIDGVFKHLARPQKDFLRFFLRGFYDHLMPRGATSCPNDDTSDHEAVTG